MEIQNMLKCPDCQVPLKLVDAKANTYWCSPCKRARVPEHMEPYVAPPVTVRAKFKRLPDDAL